MCHNHVKHASKQCSLERLKIRLKKDTSETVMPTCAVPVTARPTDERSLVKGGGGYNQGPFVYFDTGCGGWVFAGVNGVG